MQVKNLNVSSVPRSARTIMGNMLFYSAVMDSLRLSTKKQLDSN